MKKIIYAISALAAAVLATACMGNGDAELKTYKEWRDKNDKWVKDLQNRKNPDGTPYYQIIVPSWNPGAYILMHRFTNPDSTKDNLVPLYTSTVDVVYTGLNCDSVQFDTSIGTNAYGVPNASRFKCNEVVSGWSIALENMHVGDSVEVVLPYNVAYGTQAVSEAIPPYTALQFYMRLVDIYKYEAK